MKKLTFCFLASVAFVSCQKNHPPVVQSIDGSPAEGKAGTIFTLSALATDDDGDDLTYRWSADGGHFLEGTNFSQVKWQAPIDGGVNIFVLKVAVSDGKDETTHTFPIKLNPNNAPSIRLLTAMPGSGIGGTIFYLHVDGTDPDKDSLFYKWTCTEGAFPEGDAAANVKWESPQLNQMKVYTLNVSISDAVIRVEKSIDVTVTKTFLTFQDSRDNHEYKSIEIGSQTWMAENLAYLPSVNPTADWSGSLPKYYVYYYQGTDVKTVKERELYKTYGVLYNWPAAMSSCPSGWHLPTDTEWKVLEMYLGMSQSDADFEGSRVLNSVGGQLKEAGTSHWIDLRPGATNSSGFTGLPGGQCDSFSGFNQFGAWGRFWSATIRNYAPMYRLLSYDNEGVYRSAESKAVGLSVRCLKDS